MSFWKRLWAFLLNETTIDEKIEAKVTKVKEKIKTNEQNLLKKLLKK